MIRKVVIPSAGLGIRLLPATKEQPKEMLPIFTRSMDGKLCVKPLLHVIFEKIYDVGFREFCFITGRGKRIIEDYFAVDNNFVGHLKSGNKFGLANELDVFYEKIQSSDIVFINQPEPRGFGDAVYHAKIFTNKEAFLVHAGDDLVISKNSQYLMKLIGVFEKYDADAVFCVEKVRDPRKYGVIVGEKETDNLYRVQRVMEKPSTPLSNIAIVAVYLFNFKIYQAIERTPPDMTNEIQLTDAIQGLINQNNRVYAVQLNRNEKRVDIGTPGSYWTALNVTSKGMRL